MAEDAHSLLVQGELEFDFEKSNFFRVIHVDGIFGGVAPATQLLHIGIFNERQPFPKKVFHPVKDGTLQPENLQKREGRSGLFREIEADLIMSMEVAMVLRTWLDEKITEMQNIRAQLIAAHEQRG
jgi:hypothetical protein